MPAGQSQGKAAPARPGTKAPASTLKALPLNPWAPAIAPPPTRPDRTGAPFKPATSTPQQKAAAVTPNATPKARRASALRSIRLGDPLTRPQLGALVDPKAQPGSGPVRSSRPAPARAAALQLTGPLRLERPQSAQTQTEPRLKLGTAERVHGPLGRFGQPNAPLAAGITHSDLADGLLSGVQNIASRAAGTVIAGKPVSLTTATNEMAQRDLGYSRRISTLGENAGSVSRNLLSPEAQAATKGKHTLTEADIRELEKQGISALPEATRQIYMHRFVENGWGNLSDAGKLADADLIHDGFNKPAPFLIQSAKSLGGQLAQYGALPAAFAKIGGEAASGDTHGLAKDAQAIVSQTTDLIPGVSEHSFAHNVEFRPLDLATLASGVGKGAGALAGRVARLEATPRLVTAAGETINRGPLSTNALTRVGERAVDRATTSGPLSGPLGVRALRQAARDTVGRAEQAVLHEHTIPQGEYAAALRKVGNRRAAILMSHAGGLTAADWERRAAILTSEGRDASKALEHAKVLKDNPVALAHSHDAVRLATAGDRPGALKAIADAEAAAQETAHAVGSVSAHDQWYLDALRNLSHHTTGTHVDLGRFGELGATYRPYEPLIRAAADKGDPLAHDLLAARSDYLHPAPFKGVDAAASREFEHAQKAYDAGHDATLRELDKKIASFSKLRAPKLSPGQKPYLKGGSPAELRALRDRRAQLARDFVPFDGTPKGRALADKAHSGLTREAWQADRQAAEGHYADLLDQFTKRHTAQDGVDPIRIPYSQPPRLQPLTLGREPRDLGSRVASGVPGQKASTGYSAETGDYVLDPGAPLRESQQAARLKASVARFEALHAEFGHEVHGGEQAPAGSVIVKADNLRSVAPMREAVDASTILPDARDLRLHTELLDGLRSRLSGAHTVGESGVVPAGKWVALPKPVFDEMHRITRATPNTIADRATRSYKRVTFSKPSTLMSNALGNPGLAMIGGAGPLSIKRGLAATLHAPDLVAPQLRGAGPVGSVLGSASRNPLSRVIDKSLSASRFTEDAARAAVWFRHAHPVAQKAAKELNQTYEAAMRDLASGRNPDGYLIAKKVEQFLGDTKRGSGGLDTALSRVTLTHRWLGHILKLTAYTLPAKYPGRTILMQRLSEIGDEYRKKHGVWPSWYASVMPIFRHAEAVGVTGAPQMFTRTAATYSLNPFQNAGEPLPLPDTTSGSFLSGPMGVLSPLVTAPLTALTGRNLGTLDPLKDEHGQPVTGFDTQRLRAAEHAFENAVPYGSQFAPQAGRADTSTWWDPQYRRYALSPGHGRGQLPDDLRPSARPVGGLLGFGSRFLGMPLLDLPSGGIVNQVSNAKQIGYERKAARPAR